MKKLAESVKAGLDIRELLAPTSATEIFSYRKELRKRLIETMNKTAEFGRDQVKQELEKQTVK